MKRFLTDAVPMDVDLALLANAAPPAEQQMVELHLFNRTHHSLKVDIYDLGNPIVL